MEINPQKGIQSELNRLKTRWETGLSPSFDDLTEYVKHTHQCTQIAAIRAINQFATMRNWLIGCYIVEYEQNGKDRAQYGDHLLKRLEEKVHCKGLNETLFKVSRSFYLMYPQIGELFQQKSATASHVSNFIPKGKSATPSHQFITPPQKIISQLSFSHIREILTEKDPLGRFFYETECIKGCWSVKELRRQIATNLYFRSGVSRNPELLLKSTAEANSYSLMDIRQPFTFEFLGLNAEDALSEKGLEDSLLTHLEEFLLELGKGFCFEARQKRIIIDDEYYFADLVFYHRILHCNIICELKNDEFKHEYLGQLNAYVSYYKENEMHDGDNPPIGILLCTKKGKKMVEYAIAGMNNQLFVSTYMLQLPDKTSLENFLISQLNKKY